MLNDAKTADIARYALERIPAPAAERALLKALPKSSGNTKVGIISSLGQKRSAPAVPELRSLIKDSDNKIAHAAVAALANIADAQAMSALADARMGSTGPLHDRVTDAYLACADQFVRQGNKSKAETVYREVYGSDEATRLRYAALRGLVSVNADGIETTVVNAIKSDDREMQTVAIGLIREVPGSEIINQAALVFTGLPKTAQIQMISAFADRRDKAALAVVSEAVADDDQSVRVAALAALGSLGEAKTVDLLAATALSKRGDELDAARTSLARMPGEDIDAAVLDAIRKSEGRRKAEFVRTAGARNIDGATSLLISTAQDDDRSVRIESIKALKVVAKPGDLPELLRLLVEVQSDAERREALQSVSAVAHKIPDKNKQAEAALAALPTAKDAAAKGVMLQLLGRIGDAGALPVLRESLADKDVQIRTAAIRGLTEWPDSEPADALLAVARNAGDEVEKVLALRGYIRLIGLPAERSADETVHLYRTAMALSASVNERRLVLSGLANLSSLPSLTMAGEYLDDSDLNAEAEQAVLKIADNGMMRRDYPQESLEYLHKVIDGTKQESVRQEAQELIDRLDNQ
jgi:HEAT repeat protein